MNSEPLAMNQVATLLQQVKFSQAVRLAREGSYSAAEEHLNKLLDENADDVATLDLLARIYAQQGRLGEAARLWQKVLEKEPNNADAQAALTRVNALQRRPVWLQTIWPVVVGACILVCVAIVTARQARQQEALNEGIRREIARLVEKETLSGKQQMESLLGQITELKSAQAQAAGRLAKFDNWEAAQGAILEQLTQIQAQAKRLTSLQESLVQISSNQMDIMREVETLHADAKRLVEKYEAGNGILSNQIAALRVEMDNGRALTGELEQQRAAMEKLKADYQTLAVNHEALLKQIAGSSTPPAINFAVPGVRASTSGQEVVLIFDEGLFDRGVHFKPGAQARLLAVSKALSQSPEPLNIQVVGFADDERGLLKWTAQWESSLALARASTVVEHFIKLGLLQKQRLSAVVGDCQKRPFASDSVQNRLRNRTVVLRVSIDHQGR